MNLPFTFLKRSLALLITLLIGMGMGWAQPQGVINGGFSVAPNTFVYFSKGNLQYIGSAETPYWKFADHQWDYLGTTTGQDSDAQNVDRDLFGWGTSGYNHGAVCYQPWSTDQDYSCYCAYGNYNYNLFDQTGQADWGYNAISNGGNLEHSGWRTLTTEEWQYLFNTRSTPSGIRYAEATVNNINGVILLPDDWSTDYYSLSSDDDSYYGSNIITAEQWTTLEQHGAVFLPAAGDRYGTTVDSDGSTGHYWSSSIGNSVCALSMNFENGYFNNYSDYRYSGQSVRLVRTYQGRPIVNATANPAQGGEVSGASAYSAGTECTLTATASAGYTFLNWTEDGEVISTEATYTFTVTGHRTLVANFRSADATISDGALGGHFSVAPNSYVLFSQGNLQYIGNAATPYWKFAEHQWDYLGPYCQGNDSQTANRDLFGWGTSGYNHGANCYQPWSVSETNNDYYAYGNESYNLFDQTGQADWGYNAILNGGNQENSGWRTLSVEEWDYLFNDRSTPSGIRYAKATVNNINGVILLPDDWSTDYYRLNNPSGSLYHGIYVHYYDNIITAEQWTTLEQHGAVFLPAAGERNGTTVSNVGSCGNYWSSSCSNYYTGYAGFYNSELYASSHSRYSGFSVRLVRALQGYSIVSAMANPTEGGSVSGGGNYDEGAECTLTATPSEGYTFVNWTEYGEVVSTDATYTFTVTGHRTLVANFRSADVNIIDGALGSHFMVSPNTCVLFSQGNLQYIGSASTPYWKFAEHQWDYLGDNGQGSDSQTANRDLFGWGTSGWDNGNTYYQPWNTDAEYEEENPSLGYGPTDGESYEFDLCGDYANSDWGYNAIFNGGNQENSGWRTLSRDEWHYLFNTRSTPSGIRYTKARVNDINGVILLPDDWNASYYSLYYANRPNASFSNTIITATQWKTLEQHGAVFLPAGGSRNGSSVGGVGSYGSYWSASYYYSFYAWYVSFSGSDLNTDGGYYRYYGGSVRLVRDLQGYSVVNATANPSVGGVLSGAGDYEEGAQCALMATPSEGYTFINWTENGEVVSTDAAYTFTVTGHRSLVANFRSAEVNISAGALNGYFSVAADRKVSFSQGNLQYIGSAETPYWKFAEHQWDYLGMNGQGSDSPTANRDLFGWGTSGYNHGAICYQPWSTSETDSDYYAYGNESYNLFDQTGQADWGYNAILNGGNQENNGWRTLTREEWDYLFNTRSTPSGVRYAGAKVNNVNGVILLPDDWSTDYYNLYQTNGGNSSSNTINATQWKTLEQHGAVFLPAAGYRYGTWVYGLGLDGNYQSSSCNDSNESGNVFFSDYSSNPSVGYSTCSDGRSVRLVRASQGYSFVIAVANPVEGGAVSGDGAYEDGSECTLSAMPNEGYTFVNWTENGEVVSTNTTHTFMVTGNKAIVANFRSMNSDISNGALGGHFSVAPNSYVLFSQGNLQYIGSAETPYWKFAEHQWDYLGASCQGNDYQTSNRDLFGWGTSGYNHGAVCYQPWSISSNYDGYRAYNNSYSNLYDQTGQADWGYNAIYNGGNQENSGWRTLTHEEWDYLFNTRSTPSGIRYAKANVNGVSGVILLPDDWQANYYPLSDINSYHQFSGNDITAEQWAILEQFGAVFLPAAGYRYGTSVRNVGSDGDYWSSSRNSSSSAWGMSFSVSFINAGYSDGRYYGRSVRLVRASQGYSCVINVTANISEGGSVSGGGTFGEGDECTLTAIPSTGYVFGNWTENGIIVSTEDTCSLIVLRDRDLVANFYPVITEGVANGVFSVNASGGSVVFSQGNLQYIGSAATPYWKFAEYQWEYLGHNGQGSDSQTADRDLFGWGTSGYNHNSNAYQPWSNDYVDWYAYGNENANLFDQTGQADWGYNAISNGGNQENIGWRTLTHEEWTFMFESRSTSSGIRYAKAKVNNVYGVILLPDDWSADYYTLNSTNSGDVDYSSNVISANQWATLEQHGAIFLPAAGYRDGTSINYAGFYGNYWSASGYRGSARSVNFGDSFFYADASDYGGRGQSVRLVRSSQGYSFVSATANPSEGGSVSGAGNYPEGAECTLVAMPSEGYTFVNWTENGEMVSADATYTFTVTGDRELEAHFAEEEATCVIVFDLYDSYGDGYMGNYLVVDYGNGVEQLTIENGSHASYTRHVAQGSQVELSWILSDYPEDCSFTVSYEGGETILEQGDLNSDFSYVFEVDCSGGVPAQTLELSAGWNWVSFNVEITMNDLKAAIVAANPDAAPVIKSKDNGQTSYNGAIWVGALRALDLSQMYEIKVANACTVNLEGTQVNPADHPATIKKGANWIAYPLDETKSVANAFAGFPVTGDNVKSKDGGQATWNGVMWLGALRNLVPGAGYIYNSKATENKTLTF